MHLEEILVNLARLDSEMRDLTRHNYELQARKSALARELAKLNIPQALCPHPTLDLVEFDTNDGEMQATVECLACGAQGLDAGPITDYDIDQCDRQLAFIERVCRECGELGFWDTDGHEGYCDEHRPNDD